MTYLTQGDEFDGVLGAPPSTQQRSNFGFAQYSLSQFVDVDDDEEVDFDNMRTTETKIKEEEIEEEDNDSVEQDVLIEESKDDVQPNEITKTNTVTAVDTVEAPDTAPPAENDFVPSQELFTDSQEFPNDDDEIIHDEQKIEEEENIIEAEHEAVTENQSMEQLEINPEATEDIVAEQRENKVEDTVGEANTEQHIAEDTVVTEEAVNFDAESQNSMDIPIIPDDEIFCDFPDDSQNRDFFDEPVTTEPSSPVPTEQPNPSTTSPEKIQLQKVEKVDIPASTQASPFKKSIPKDDIEVVVKPSPTKRYQPPLDVEQAGKYFNLSTLQRGIGYKDEGRVFNMDDECLCDADNTQLMKVTSKCWGTRLDAYDTEVLVQIDSKNNIKITRARCNCPMTADCKHCVASIMVWLECRRENKPIPRTESLAARLRDTTSELLKMKEEMDTMQKEHETLKIQVASLVEMVTKQKDVKMKEPAPVVKQSENNVLGKRKNREEKDDETADSDIEYHDASQEDEPSKKVKKTVHFEEMPTTLLYSPFDSQSQSSQQHFLDY